jgi:hypothetical protein
VQTTTANAIGNIIDAEHIPYPAWTQLHASITKAGGGLLPLEELQLLFEEGTEKTKVDEQTELERLHQPRISKSVASANQCFADNDSRQRFALQGADWRFSFLTAFPTMRPLTMSDGAFRRALRFLLNRPSDDDMLVCPEYFRPNAQPQHRVLAPDHSRACPTCTAAMRYLRHENLIAVWCKCSRLFGHPISTNVRALLGESATALGEGKYPDAFYFSSGVCHPCLVLLDMKVAHASMHPQNNAADTCQLRAAYTRKITRYRPLTESCRSSTEPDRILQPIIFNTHGVPSTKTAEYAHEFGKNLRPGYARETLMSCGIKILEDQHCSLESWYVACRGSLRTCTAVERDAPPAMQHSSSSAAAAPSTPRNFAPAPAHTPQMSQSMGQPTGSATSPPSRECKGKRGRGPVCECGTKISKDGTCTNVCCFLLRDTSRVTGSERRRLQLLDH